MTGFTFKLERHDGILADPLRLKMAVPNWRQGDEIPLGPGRALRVVGIRDDDADRPPTLIVEDLPRAAASDVA